MRGEAYRGNKKIYKKIFQNLYPREKYLDLKKTTPHLKVPGSVKTD